MLSHIGKRIETVAARCAGSGMADAAIGAEREVCGIST